MQRVVYGPGIWQKQCGNRSPGAQGNRMATKSRSDLSQNVCKLLTDPNRFCISKEPALWGSITDNWPHVAGKQENHMKKEVLKVLILKGKSEEAIKILLDISNKFLLSFSKEIILISSRYNALKADKMKGVISNREYKSELNSINEGLLGVIGLLDQLDESKIKAKSNFDLIEKIRELDEKFSRCDDIEATTSRLRMKNEIAKSISENIIQYPDALKEFLPLISDGIICGLSKRIQEIPKFGDLDLIESSTGEINSNFTKGCVTNAIAELVYSQKLRIGDAERTRKILNALKRNSDVPLMKNIERVEAALDYLVSGKGK